MLSWYVISHSGQLSLLPSAGREMSAGQEREKQWQCSAAGKVSVGLASHWPCVTDWFSGLTRLTSSDQ